MNLKWLCISHVWSTNLVRITDQIEEEEEDEDSDDNTTDLVLVMMAAMVMLDYMV